MRLLVNTFRLDRSSKLSSFKEVLRRCLCGKENMICEEKHVWNVRHTRDPKSRCFRDYRTLKEEFGPKAARKVQNQRTWTECLQEKRSVDLQQPIHCSKCCTVFYLDALQALRHNDQRGLEGTLPTQQHTTETARRCAWRR